MNALVKRLEETTLGTYFRTRVTRKWCLTPFIPLLLVMFCNQTQAQLIGGALPDGTQISSNAFVLIKGKSARVCQAYKKYLDETYLQPKDGGDLTRSNLNCGRTIPPGFPEFSQPKWRKTDVKEILALAVSIELSRRIQPPESDGASRAKTRNTIEESLTAGRDGESRTYFLADVDINNDGRKEKLVKFQSGRCTTDWPASSRFVLQVLVANSELRLIDFEKSRQLLQLPNTFRAEGKLLRMPLIQAGTFDTFMFDGQSYVDRWEDEGRDSEGRGNEVKTLTITRHKGASSSDVCKFKFQPE